MLKSVQGLLEAGIAAAKAGETTMARRMLRHVVQEAPESERAWLWLSQVAETPEERRACIDRVLAINPDHAVARAGRRWLAAQDAVSPQNAASPQETLSPEAPSPQAAVSPDDPARGAAAVATPAPLTKPAAGRWSEAVRVTLGLWLAPILAAWVNARLVITAVAPLTWLALLVVGVGSYFWASASDAPHNPGMQALFGEAGLDTPALRLLIGGSGVVLWLMAFGLILIKV